MKYLLFLNRIFIGDDSVIRKIAVLVFLFSSIFSQALGASLYEKLENQKELEVYSGIVIEASDREVRSGNIYQISTGQPFTGRVILRDKKGKISSIYETVNGKKEGLHYYYSGSKIDQMEEYLTGEMLYIILYDKNGRRTAFRDLRVDPPIVKTYYPSGKLWGVAEAKIVDKDKGSLVPNGYTELFNEDGRKFSDMTFKDGELDGYMRMYKPNGELFCKVMAKGMRFDGEAWFYYPNGEVQLYVERLVGTKYETLVLFGNCEIYDQSGEILYEGYFDGVSVKTLSKEKTGEIKNRADLLKVLNKYL